MNNYKLILKLFLLCIFPIWLFYCMMETDTFEEFKNLALLK